MDRQIEQMVTKYIQAAKMIIHRNGKIGDKAAWPESPDFSPLAQAPNIEIVRDGTSLRFPLVVGVEGD